VALNRLDEAKNVANQASANKLEDASLRDNVYYIAFLQNDAAGMEKQLNWAVGKPGIEDLFFTTQADTEAYYGRLAKSHELLLRAVSSARSNDAVEAAALYQSYAALHDAEFGEFSNAQKEADAALSIANSRSVEIFTGLAFARSGNATRASALADQLNKEFPVNTLVQAIWLPAIHAGVEMSRNNPDKAIEDLQPASPYDLGAAPPVYGMYAVFVRGEAYLQAHRGKEAAAEFQKLIDHRGIVANSATGALAHLGLARGYALQGDSARARAAYQDFLGIWKDADADIPVLVAAKAEYAKLK
jgi:eukaryotic-like serine/threonine-protein kinase